MSSWQSIVDVRSQYEVDTGMAVPWKSPRTSGESLLTECGDDCIDIDRDVFKYLNPSDSDLLAKAARDWIQGVQVIADLSSPDERLKAYQRDDVIERSDLLRVCIHQISNCLSNPQTPIILPATEPYVPLAYILPDKEATLAPAIALQVAELLKARSTRVQLPVNLQTNRAMFWAARDQHCRPVMLWRIREQPLNKTDLHSLLTFMLEYARLNLFVPGVADKCVFLVDCRGFNLHKFSLAKFRSVKKLIARQFPMITSRTIIIPNSQTSVAWELVKHFLSEREQKTISICSRPQLGSVLEELGLDPSLIDLTYRWPYPIHDNEVLKPVKLEPISTEQPRLTFPVEHSPPANHQEPVPAPQVLLAPASRYSSMEEPPRLTATRILNPFASDDGASAPRQAEEDFLSHSPRATSDESTSSSAYSGEPLGIEATVMTMLSGFEEDNYSEEMSLGSIRLETLAAVSRGPRRSLLSSSEDDLSPRLTGRRAEDEVLRGAEAAYRRDEVALSMFPEAYKATPVQLPGSLAEPPISPSSAPPRAQKIRMSRAISPRALRSRAEATKVVRADVMSIRADLELGVKSRGPVQFYSRPSPPPHGTICCFRGSSSAELVV